VPTDKTINAEPTKEFFIEMLTKDISLPECILDLVDNSVNSLIRATGLDVMKVLIGNVVRRIVHRKIRISFSRHNFSIEDDCGGITIADARDDVFRFGKSQPQVNRGGLGVYGIGMKRAFFKIGRMISIHSRTTTEEFLVKFDVDDWAGKKDNWNLEFTTARERLTPASKAGTVIEITRLHETVKSRFAVEAFQKELLRKLGATYALFLRAGLQIRLPREIYG
jgi:Histidine kinase-, DNA gyrase B-, and HSP90-like ATPase